MREWAERWLSVERLAPYRACCENDIDRALSLYEWNVSLGQILMRDISHFEVALRNAYDALMRERWSGEDYWLLDDASPVRRPIMRKSKHGELDVNRINRKIIDSAVDGLPSGFTMGSLVARLTLGFWVHLTDRSRESELWRTNLYLAWLKGTNRSILQQSLDGILGIRNRVAHAERLFNPRTEKLSPLIVGRDICRLMGALCPDAARRIYGSGEKTSVGLFLENNPSPSEIVL